MNPKNLSTLQIMTIVNQWPTDKQTEFHQRLKPFFRDPYHGFRKVFSQMLSEINSHKPPS